MKKVLFALAIMLLFSCAAPAVNYYRVVIKTEDGQVVYDKIEPNGRVNIRRLSGGVVEVKVINSPKLLFYTDRNVKFSVIANNLMVARELVKSEI
jgi:hypothetical protein